MKLSRILKILILLCLCVTLVGCGQGAFEALEGQSQSENEVLALSALAPSMTFRKWPKGVIPVLFSGFSQEDANKFLRVCNEVVGKQIGIECVSDQSFEQYVIVHNGTYLQNNKLGSRAVTYGVKHGYFSEANDSSLIFNGSSTPIGGLFGQQSLLWIDDLNFTTQNIASGIFWMAKFDVEFNSSDAIDEDGQLQSQRQLKSFLADYPL